MNDPVELGRYAAWNLDWPDNLNQTSDENFVYTEA